MFGLRARDVMGYTFIVFLVLTPVVIPAGDAAGATLPLPAVNEGLRAGFLLRLRLLGLGVLDGLGGDLALLDRLRAELLGEPVHAAFGVDQLLAAREERVALRAKSRWRSLLVERVFHVAPQAQCASTSVYSGEFLAS